jgi:hypothetical protein
MKTAPHQQAQSQPTTKLPGWLHDSKSRPANFERPQLADPARVVPAHDDHGDEEPGYGHGV